MTSGRGVLLQLLFWRVVLGSQKAALKWYKLIIIVIVVIIKGSPTFKKVS
jgi:hypothetical protein